MIKNLVISKIPTNEEDLEKVLQEIGDFTWCRKDISIWVAQSNGVIYYSKAIKGYVWSFEGEIPKDTSEFIFKEYKDIVSEGQNYAH